MNSFISALVRLGVKLPGTYLLSVAGRRSGKIHTTPVTLVEQGGQRWVTIVELGPQESAPVLKEYLKRVPTVRPYFDATPDSPLEAFVAEAARHPVFRISEGA